VVLTLSLTALTATALPAGAAHRIGPDQYFAGVINGTDGNTVTPIPVQMGCFGPITPGETGHPLAGQTLAVHQLFPPVASSGLGQTGDDSSIDVFFGAVPPGAGHASGARSKTVQFTHYDKIKALPTSLTLPCSGTGTVWFVPVPVTPPSQSEAVPVQFESQP
jgi:hypothetical protein